MQIDWSQLLNRRVLVWGGGVLVLLLCFPTLFHLTFASRNEVSFSANTGITTCLGVFIGDAEDAASCVTNYQITLGNTGAERAPAPRVSQQLAGDALEFQVENLHPNRLVEIRFTTRGIDAYEALQSMTALVKADGVVIATNPHVTVLARFARAVFGLFGA